MSSPKSAATKDARKPQNAGKKSQTAKPELVTIYGLIDPRTAKIRYIGKANNPKNRMRQHLNPRSNEKITPVKAWIKSLAKHGLVPCMITIEKCVPDQWEEKEKFWIKRFKDEGNNILNIAEGGNQPYCSNETRKLNGAKSNNWQDSMSIKEQGVLQLLRSMNEAAKRAADNGLFDRKNYFESVREKIKNSGGEARARLNDYGLSLIGALP